MVKHSRFWLARQLLVSPLEPRYAQPDDCKDAAAVLACPFNCYLHGNSPDQTNMVIARLAAKYVGRYAIPFIGQWEHTNLLRSWGLGKVFEFASSDGERVQSQRLIRWQARMLSQLGPNRKVITIGLPEHLGRVVALQEYFGLCPRVAPESAAVPYDPSARSGAQDWCKSYRVFVPYERRIARPGTIAKLFLTPWEFAR